MPSRGDSKDFEKGGCSEWTDEENFMFQIL